MFKFFSSRSQKPTKISHKKTKSGENPLIGGVLQSRSSKEREGRGAEDIVLQGADRQLYKFDLPEQQRGMGDLLDSHEQGTVFPHFAITERETETYESRMRELTLLQPRIKSRRLDIPDMITVKLFKQVEEFPLQSIIIVSKKKDIMDYILVRKILFIFTPLSSFIDEHTDVLASVVDMRLRNQNNRRSVNLQSNTQYKGGMSLDHCIPKESLSKLSLSISQEVPFMNTGEQWGACQIFLDIEESDYPQISAFQETIGLAAGPETILRDYRHNPAHLDISMKERHRKRIQELFSQGDIVDETEPKHDKMKKVEYSKSSAPIKSAMRKVTTDINGPDWSQVKNTRAMLADDLASIDPEEDEDITSIPDSLIKMRAHEEEKEEEERHVGFASSPGIGF